MFPVARAKNFLVFTGPHTLIYSQQPSTVVLRLLTKTGGWPPKTGGQPSKANFTVVVVLSYTRFL